ncbi:MAG: ribonuclease HII [Candidatus Omnitrophica bacterium]|nr:ribonuclease HII [Candidatus Omnitrophota bacterium]
MGSTVKIEHGLNFQYEDKASAAGYGVIAGIDEAGRGPLAGPVVAAAVIVRARGFLERIDDSKKLSAKKRELAYLEIMSKCDVGIGVSGPGEIDEVNIFNATLLAMKRAVGELKTAPDFLLIDGKMDVPLPTKRAYLIRGESKSTSIACASIIAKVTRDRMMLDEDAKYPEYGFKQHKAYGTRAHLEAIKKFGFSPIHRRSFGPFGGKEGGYTVAGKPKAGIQDTEGIRQ